MLHWLMRVIAHGNLVAYWMRHPKSQAGLQNWYETIRGSRFESMHEIGALFGKAKILNGERVRFEIHGGDYRLIANFDFRNQRVFLKFLGTHAEYDRINALTVSMF